jgi:hypothetical protein
MSQRRKDCSAHPRVLTIAAFRSVGVIAREKTEKQPRKRRTVLDNRFHRTDLTLSCAAKAHVPKPKRRAGCRG